MGRILVPTDGSDVSPEGQPRPDGEVPPLLKTILQEYSATGLPPAYLPKRPPLHTGDAS